MNIYKNKQILSWAFYDWANSAFATTVLAGFFPLFFKQYWASELSATDSTSQLGFANALASLVIVFVAPVLGAIADQGGLKKTLLLVFAALGICMSFALYFVAQGNWSLALGLFVLAVIGFSASILFNDALLTDICEPDRYDRVSSFGYAMGYLGGGLLFAINVAMVSKPGWFGFVDAAEAVRFAFITVAAWWLIFSIPLWLFVHETPISKAGDGKKIWRSAMQQLAETISHVRQLKQVSLFLLAYWLYIDGVDTIVRMAVDYGLAIGLEGSDLLLALLMTQFIGFPAAIAFGLLGERIGAKQGILLAILVYLLVTVWAYRMETAQEFYILAMIIGLVQGGIQSLSRSFYARLIPKHRSAEFFGFYNMLGKFAAVIGPLLVGAVAAASNDSRLAMLSVSVLFVAGGVLLYGVKQNNN